MGNAYATSSCAMTAGAFTDVTVGERTVVELIASESAAWGDYDDDGFADVFVCGEYLPPGDAAVAYKTETLAIAAGCITIRAMGRLRTSRMRRASPIFAAPRARPGAITTATDGLICSSRTWGSPAGCTTTKAAEVQDVAPDLGVSGPDLSFACWFWDFDNDGHLDLYVNDYLALAWSRCWRRNGCKRFKDRAGLVSIAIWAATVFATYRRRSDSTGRWPSMGANFGDIDNDGYLDIYLGNRRHVLPEGLDVNLFVQITSMDFDLMTSPPVLERVISRRGTVVSFADFDSDGDLDIFVELGGGDARRSGLQRFVPEPPSRARVAQA